MDTKKNNEIEVDDAKLTEAETLIWSLLDDEIDTAGTRRLEQMLQEDEQIRQLYVRCVHMHTDLQEHFGTISESQDDIKPPASPVLGSLGNVMPNASSTPPVVD